MARQQQKALDHSRDLGTATILHPYHPLYGQSFPILKIRKVEGQRRYSLRSEDDEWLNYKLNERDAKMLYELFEQRSGNNSTVFVGQFPVSEWHDRLGGGTQADSIMDRIVHNAYEIPSSETNLRKIYDSKKLANLKAEIEK